MTAPLLRIVRLPSGAGDHPIEAPAYATTAAAGLDLRAALNTPATLLPGNRLLIPTGFAFQIPHGFEGQVRPRSGLALKHGLTVLNAPGTIDADYRGEVGVILINLGQVPVVVERHQRVAQLVIAPVAQVSVVLVDALTKTQRGAGGFGHTGL